MKPYYADESCVIYHGDFREVIEDRWRGYVLITDPPYGIAGTPSNKNEYASFDDTQESVKPLIDAMFAKIDFVRAAISSGVRMMYQYPEPDSVGAFYTPASTGRCRWGFVGFSPILYYGKDPYLANGLGSRNNSRQVTEISEKNGHPCPKPIRTWSWLVQRASLAGETIIDPFMGSGTTLRAAKDLQRAAVGIEIEERYCEIAAKRLEQEVLFGPDELDQEQIGLLLK